MCRDFGTEFAGLLGRWKSRCVAALVGMALVVGGAGPVRAELVLEWNAEFLSTVRAQTTAPVLAARNLAMFHVAMHDALNAVEPRYETFLPVSAQSPVVRGKGRPEEGRRFARASACFAACEVAVSLYPVHRAKFDAVCERLLAEVRRTGLSQEHEVEARRMGRAVGREVLRWREGDGASRDVTYIPSQAPGQWRRTPKAFRPPENPQWRYVRCFAIERVNAFLPPGPPALKSAEYAADYQEVFELGGARSLVRTSEQSLIARFWSDFSYTVTPPGHWNMIAEEVARAEKMKSWESARLFALLNLAMADAGIVAWEAKYRYNFWRPVTAIVRADEDGNPATFPAPGWMPMLPTPPHPDYVSGHSIFSGAAGEVLRRCLGRDKFSFSVGNDNIPGVRRSFESFSQCEKEISMSRVYAGIHFGAACRDGVTAGRKIAEYVSRERLKPLLGVKTGK